MRQYANACLLSILFADGLAAKLGQPFEQNNNEIIITMMI